MKDAWKNLMGNGVNSYTQNVVLKGSTLYVELIVCFEGRIES
jgi:hypothetical protein